jgi:hypothetical protein
MLVDLPVVLEVEALTTSLVIQEARRRHLLWWELPHAETQVGKPVVPVVTAQALVAAVLVQLVVVLEVRVMDCNISAVLVALAFAPT